MICVGDEEGKGSEDFGGHGTFNQTGKSFHKGWEYIMTKSLSFESIQEPLHNSYIKLAKDYNLPDVDLRIRNSLLALN
jgi:hypothetical protein